MNSIKTFIHLRILVASLGERQNAGWWQSSFLSAVGIKTLSYVFPRSPELAAIQGAVEAARRVHDARIGVKGTIHIFRQPYEVELAILDHLKEQAELDLKRDMSTIYIKPEYCKNELAKLAEKAEKGTGGPILVAKSDGLPDQATLKKMAALYLGAFESGKPVFPYLLSYQ